MTQPVSDTGLLAVTFDWYKTLADHRSGIGRRRQFEKYLGSRSLKAAPWDRRVLYSVFDYYASTYRLEFSDQEKRLFWIEFARILFERARVNCPADQVHDHADTIRGIFGSTCFCLFPDVKPVLSALKARGLRLGIVSN